MYTNLYYMYMCDSLCDVLPLKFKTNVRKVLPLNFKTTQKKNLKWVIDMESNQVCKQAINERPSNHILMGDLVADSS